METNVFIQVDNALTNEKAAIINSYIVVYFML